MDASSSIHPHDSAFFSEEQLRAANVNPITYLATDYLNHFNEIIMLMDMLHDMPDMASEVLAWQPKSYAEHFSESGFKEKDTVIKAYQLAPTDIRRAFDNLVKELDTVLMTGLEDIRTALEMGANDLTDIATMTTDSLRPLIDKASGLINGKADPASIVSQVEEHAQDAIDALFD